MQSIRELCYMYTNLSDDDITKLEHIAEVLPFISNLVEADVFIDCPTIDPNEAIVIAEAKPSNHYSMYKNSVVGELALRENEPAALRTLEIGMPTRDLKALTQECMNVRQTVEPIKNDKDRTIGVLIIEKDLTENNGDNKNIELFAETSKLIGNKIHSNSNNEGNITYHIDDAIIIFDENGVVRFVNPVAEKLYQKLGYRDKLIGMDFENISLDNKLLHEISCNSEFDTSEVNIGNLTLQVKYIYQSSKVLNLVMLIKDITDMKQKEKELILKSVAIKEIHHRVKNNLQTIASLLRLQSRRIDNMEIKSALDESMNRILSIAATHEILAQEGIDEVDIKEVIQQIKLSISRCFNISSDKINITVEGDGFKIDSDKSTSIALIVNELLQNSLQYAFEGRAYGDINIKIQRGKVYSSISVVDDGMGFDTDLISNKSLGLNIVKSLVKDKLHGNFNIVSNCNGTKILFDFKN
ncbi:histidine kinase N-terminal domain-containing protein [Oceanirhabdus seepicola]|uniref:histidine kinase n=1 Tax=Oceanirhabdus seepicola TaxID=2828781 RepID=A0A9J6P4R8_9CLOT|nr:histidine kinase N-terminal domain-containing protein [Oceanirhabdus seepicola]MCM1991228.1 histidine kinase N-terminal domain-containing protein [Oceanirhabdus seepicola]